MELRGQVAHRGRWAAWAFSGVALLATLGSSCRDNHEEGVGAAGTAGAATTTTTTKVGVTGVTGGTLDTLNFAIVGDTRPTNQDDLAGYPTAVITKIWQDVEAFSPHPAFTITTGDYVFANTFGTGAAAQFDVYLKARAAYTGVMFPTLGNHECTTATTSNCGPGNMDGMPHNYTTYIEKMLTPLGLKDTYFTVQVASTKGDWTAKFVFIAANAWNTVQESWLDAELAKSTTYTFVVRHEGVNADTAPGVTPSEAILAKHPYTLKIVGHTHTYQYSPKDREVIVGNGGAPLSSAVNYGYVVAQQRADGAIEFKSFDYMTNASVQTFAVKADGTPTN